MQTPRETAVSSSGLLSIIFHTSPFAMAILAMLLIFSLFSWAIILRKWLTFRHMEHQGHRFIAFFRQTSRLSEVNAACANYRGTPLAGLFTAGYQELNLQIHTSNARDPKATINPGHASLGERQLAGIQRSLQRASAAELTVLERNMSWLATTGSVTPFIGLLGTVVGIISAFEGLGMEKTASIQAVAPGIADALVATAAGLFAAIPAVVAYNQFIQRIKTVGAEMDDFSAEFINLIERSFG